MKKIKKSNVLSRLFWFRQEKGDEMCSIESMDGHFYWTTVKKNS